MFSILAMYIAQSSQMLSVGTCDCPCLLPTLLRAIAPHHPNGKSRTGMLSRLLVASRLRSRAGIPSEQAVLTPWLGSQFGGATQVTLSGSRYPGLRPFARGGHTSRPRRARDACRRVRHGRLAYRLLVVKLDVLHAWSLTAPSADRPSLEGKTRRKREGGETRGVGRERHTAS